MDLGLNEKSVLVTGGARGIGREVVSRFVVEGALVAFVDRDAEAGTALAEQLASGGGEVVFVTGDLTDDAVCRRAVDEALARFGRLDVLVNNAGVNDAVGLDAGVGPFNESLQRNLVHVYAMAHHGVEALKQSRGCIVNVSSKVSVTGQGGTSGYAAAKGAVNALTREWAAELARDGVRVNAVVPAEVWTDMYASWLGSTDDPAEEKRRIERLIPLGRRFTTPAEIADTVLFLASERASHTTGQIVFMDGGYTHLDRKLGLGD